MQYRKHMTRAIYHLSLKISNRQEKKIGLVFVLGHFQPIASCQTRKFNNKCVGGEHKKYISLHTTLHIIDDSDRTRHGRPVSSRKCQDYDFHEPMLGVFNGQSVEKINAHVHLSTKFVIGKFK